LSAKQAETDTQRLRAEGEKRAAQRNLYLADMLIAQQAWEEGNVGRVRELLSTSGALAPGEGYRNFEWYHWWRRSHTDLRTFAGHRDDISGLAVAPDGRTMATAGKDGVVRLWDLATGTARATVQSSGREALSVAFSPASDLLASGDVEGQVRVWDARSGAEV